MRTVSTQRPGQTGTLKLMITLLIAVILSGAADAAREEVNPADPKNGGSVVYYPELLKGLPVKTRLLIESEGSGWMIWAGGQNGQPLDFVFSFRGMCPVTVSSLTLQRVGK